MGYMVVSALSMQFAFISAAKIGVHTESRNFSHEEAHLIAEASAELAMPRAVPGPPSWRLGGPASAGFNPLGPGCGTRAPMMGPDRDAAGPIGNPENPNKTRPAA